MELQSLHNAAGFSRGKGFVEGGRGVRVQVILHQANILGVRIDLIDQEAARSWRSPAWCVARSPRHAAGLPVVPP
jgi:hypothetical protein